MGIILAIVLAISAGVSFGAQSSLPGDNLYPIKIGVNERVGGWLAISSEAESRHQANLALRRLEEAGKLESEGRLDADIKSKLENDFKMHAEAADREADDLESEGKTEEANSIRASIQTSIRANGNALGIVEIGGSVNSDTKIEVKEEGEVRIVNDIADLKLVNRDGTLVLSGKLNRANPCVDWKIATVMTKDMPSSNVSFNITKHSTAEVCIQVLGEPQEIEVKVPNVSVDATVSVKIEAKTVFSGKVK